MSPPWWGWVGAAVAVMLSMAWAGTRRITTTRHRIGEPSGERPLRLVHLTDLHLRTFDGLARRVAGVAAALEPDLLLLTGDAIDGPAGLHGLDALDRVLGRIGVGGFAVMGNEEYRMAVDPERLRDTYARHGVRLLVNEAAPVETRLGTVAVVGLDAYHGRPEPRGPNGMRGSRMVVLGHQPWLRYFFPSEDPGVPHWMVAGHTHGGQVRLPGWVPVVPPGTRETVGGWYRDRLPWLYVSRGIGTSGIPLRLFAPPEIAVFEWWPE